MLPFEHHPVLSRQYPYKLRSVVVPLVEDPPRDRALRVLQVPHDQRMQLLEFVAIADRTQLDHPGVAARWERAVFVKHVRHTAAHAGREVTAGLAQNHDQAARHVLASMVADALDDRVRAAVTHRESLAGYAAEERFAAGRAVERDVADNDVVLGLEGRCFWRTHGDKSARQSLAAVVVRVALEMERDSGREPRTETLAGRTFEMNLDRVGRQSLRAETPRHFRRQHRADGAVHVADGKMDFDRLAMLERVLCKLDDLVVERGAEAVILQFDTMQRFVRPDVRTTKNIGQIDVARLPMRDRFVG